MNKIISYKEFLNESKSAIITEANQEEQIKKEVISKLSDFFGCAPGNLSKFNFDGKDNIKELTKALRSTSDEGTAQYYRVAILMAKRDLGIHESEEVNEAKKQITIKFTKSNQSEVSSYVFNRLEHEKLVDTGNNGPDYMDLKFDAKDHDKVIDTLRRCDAIDSIDESEEFEINEAVSTPEELASFIAKEEKHFAAFLKPKKISASVNGKVVTIKPCSGSFTITVDYDKSTISSTGKPEWPESTSYVELMEYIKITKFKLNESSVNEKMDTKYWIGYHDQGDTFAPKEFRIKSKDFESTFDEAVEEWNREAEGPSNQVKGANLKNIEKMAMEFFKIETWISVNVIQAMIMQES